MSPRWGFRILGRPVLYKHAAPLGLKKTFGCPVFYKHSGALGYLVGPVLYKHAAPLGLNAPMNLFHLPAFLSSAVDIMRRSILRITLAHVAPLGL